MTDLELLEAAARAAGLRWSIADLVFYDDSDGSFVKQWNPLTDDGDALRLAVRLNIWPVRAHGREAVFVQRGAAYWDEIAECEIVGDPYAATRRAIVLAAAEPEE